MEDTAFEQMQRQHADEINQFKVCITEILNI